LRVRVLYAQPRSPVSTVIYRSAFPVRLSASCHAAGPRIEPCWPHFVGLMASPAGAVELLRCVSARVEAPIFAKNGFWAPCVRAKGARAFPPGVTLLKRHPPDKQFTVFARWTKRRHKPDDVTKRPRSSASICYVTKRPGDLSSICYVSKRPGDSSSICYVN
jgi:hypothetical protein